MALPKFVTIKEVGPREGYQFEGIGQPDKISTTDKIRLVEALSGTGLKTIEVTSFVHPKVVPQMADAEAVVEGLHMKPGITYTGIYLNDVGLRRAIATGKLTINGSLTLTASESFSKRNQNRSLTEDREMLQKMAAVYREHSIRVESASLMAAFGCNYEGDVPLSRVVNMCVDLYELVSEAGYELKQLNLADTMGWANPEQIRRTVDAVRDRLPNVAISLHLHDTRGLGIANVYAALLEGVDRFDAAVAGLGGCPFAGQKGAAGNVCSEEVVFLCRELGIETGVDLDKLAECAALAEEIVGHPVPSKVLRGGTMSQFRTAVA